MEESELDPAAELEAQRSRADLNREDVLKAAAHIKKLLEVIDRLDNKAWDFDRLSKVASAEDFLESLGIPH